MELAIDLLKTRKVRMLIKTKQRGQKQTFKLSAYYCISLPNPEHRLSKVPWMSLAVSRKVLVRTRIMTKHTTITLVIEEAAHK